MRNHNLAFGPKDDQATPVDDGGGSLVLVALERFLRVTLGSEATNKDTRTPCTNPVLDGVPGVTEAGGRGRSVSSEPVALAGAAEAAR
jgi:hypothetical protein